MVGHGGYPSGAVPSPDSTRPLRGAVLGLGMIGRHHARLLQASPRVAFAGAVDPGGDRFGAVHDPRLVFGDLDALLRAGPPDFAIVAVPTEEHVAAVSRLAAEGVHVLVEKPLAATVGRGAARSSRRAQAAGIHAAVGHVERFNPALLTLRERDPGGRARRGLPGRHRAHRPLPGPRARRRRRQGPRHPRPRPRALARRRARRARERRDPAPDGPRARGPRARHRAPGERDRFNCVVDWLSPTKVRRTRVLGERGMLVADTLTADLTFYAQRQGGLGVGEHAGAARRLARAT